MVTRPDGADVVQVSAGARPGPAIRGDGRGEDRQRRTSSATVDPGSASGRRRQAGRHRVSAGRVGGRPSDKRRSRASGRPRGRRRSCSADGHHGRPVHHQHDAVGRHGRSSGARPESGACAPTDSPRRPPTHPRRRPPMVAVVAAAADQTLSQKLDQPGAVRIRRQPSKAYNPRGFYGAFQFSLPTWQSHRSYRRSSGLQLCRSRRAAAAQLQARSGWGQWPQLLPPARLHLTPTARTCSAVVLTRRQAAELLDRFGLRPSRALGQNFLVDPNTIERIVRLARVGPDDRVAEIGAGLGSLTLGLARLGRIQFAPSRPTGTCCPCSTRCWPMTGVRGHACRRDRGATGRTCWTAAPGWVVVANLPYNVGTTIVLDLLEHAPMVDRLLVMVQQEVAERLAAGPGSPAYGIPSVLVSYWAEAEVVGRVGPECLPCLDPRWHPHWWSCVADPTRRSMPTPRSCSRWCGRRSGSGARCSADRLPRSSSRTTSPRRASIRDDVRRRSISTAGRHCRGRPDRRRVIRDRAQG